MLCCIADDGEENQTDECFRDAGGGASYSIDGVDKEFGVESDKDSSSDECKDCNREGELRDSASSSSSSCGADAGEDVGGVISIFEPRRFLTACSLVTPARFFHLFFDSSVKRVLFFSLGAVYMLTWDLSWKKR